MIAAAGGADLSTIQFCWWACCRATYGRSKIPGEWSGVRLATYVCRQGILVGFVSMLGRFPSDRDASIDIPNQLGK